jgi:Tfp pilus assembly protein PilF
MRTAGRSTVVMLRFAAAVLAWSLPLVVECGGDTAAGQTADMAGVCTGRAQASPEDRIRACSSLIDKQSDASGKNDSERLAVLYTSRGAAWRQKGEFDRALKDHDAAIRLQPGSALLYFNRAIIWQSKDEADRAIADFGEAIRRAPRFALAYRSRGNLLYEKADYAGAIRDYDAAIRLATRDARALTLRGLAKWQLGDGEGGKADIAAAMRIDVATAVALVERARPAGTAAKARRKAEEDKRVVRRSSMAGGTGGEPFDDGSANPQAAPVGGFTVTIARSVADRRQKLVARVQTHWSNAAGPVHGGSGGAVMLGPETHTIGFDSDEPVRQVTIFHRRFKWPDPANAPVWVSGIRVRTAKRTYTLGDADGTATECILAEGEQIVGLFGRAGAYVDALGCLIR